MTIEAAPPLSNATALLLNPSRRPGGRYPDERSDEIMRRTIEFFEKKGKRALKDDDRDRVWYSDLLEFFKNERVFATLLTPAQYGADDCRWDTNRFCEFAEILGFYGLHYWYVWQVSILGLGPIWMSPNEQAKQRAAKLLEEGAIFGFGLSEREHGADLYSSDMELAPQAGGGYIANGDKYYIGNGNEAAMVSTFGKLTDTGEYVFFATDSQHPAYNCVRNVVNSQSYVSEFELNDYPISEEDVLSRGDDAWNAALNAVNIGKYNLGWASIGISTHAFYEAIAHAASRNLYGMHVTDFPHVKRMFSDAYARLVAMKLVARRACDYMRSASADDRRYLLYNPIVKMKVTTEGEKVVDLLWDVIAAKGFERDMYFEMAGRDIRALPKLEGTVHVNIALIVKFMPSFLFDPVDYPEIPRRDDAANDDFLFDQGPTRGLSKIRFHDYNLAFNGWDVPNVAVFRDQVEVFKRCMAEATPDEAQRKDIDFLMGVGELFAQIVYAQLVLENARMEEIEDDVVDAIFDVLVRDFSQTAVELHGRPSSSTEQMAFCLEMVRKPEFDPDRYERVWNEHVLPLNGAYEMSA